MLSSETARFSVVVFPPRPSWRDQGSVLHLRRCQRGIGAVAFRGPASMDWLHCRPDRWLLALPCVWRERFSRQATLGEGDVLLQERANAMIGGETTIVAGIEIPSTDPVFLAEVLVVHIPLGVACVAIGAIAMLSQKRRGRHSKFGTRLLSGACSPCSRPRRSCRLCAGAKTITCSFWSECRLLAPGSGAQRSGAAGGTGSGSISREWACRTF